MRYAFINGKILDGSKDMRPVEKTILTDGDTIIAIQDVHASCAGYEVIDLKGKYIMPGLINMHVHLAGNGKPQKKQRDYKKLVDTIFSTSIGRLGARKTVEEYAKIELMSGVTTIRTVGGLRKLDSVVRDEINTGLKEGPRILCANEAITVPGGHMAGSVAKEAGTIEEAIRLVRERSDEKCDLVKLMITGGVMDAKEKGMPGEVKMSERMVEACVKEAEKHGMYVSAHVESAEGVKLALRSGVRSIEHGAKPDEEMMRLFREHGAFLITTLSCAIPYALFDPNITNVSEVEHYNGNVVFEGIKECSKAAIENGIPVGLGNDVGCPWISQYDFWRELVYFHRYVGVSNAFALHTATLQNAKLAGIDSFTGSIEEGKCADMIVTKENPLDDLHALKYVDMVIHQGKVIRNPKVKKNILIEPQLDAFC